MKQLTRLGVLGAVAATFAAPVNARVSSPVAASCLIETVVLVPADKPDTAQIFGACALAQSDQMFTPLGPPARGYLYYFLPADKVALTRTEWADLVKNRGTADGVSFGDRTRARPRLRALGEKTVRS